MSRPRRRLLRAPSAVVLTAVLLSGGCAAMPTDGPVTEGRNSRPDPVDLSVLAPEPARGANPVEIARGFVNAAVATEVSGGTERAYTTARSFLTPSRAAEWQPDAGTVVYSGAAPDYELSADGRSVPDGRTVDPAVDQVVVTVSVRVSGTIDPRGRWSPAPPATTRSMPMTVVRTADGQWRVDEVPDGVLVAESYLGLTYAPHELHFLDPTGQRLVAETRWFPRRASNATVLARELIDGPSRWLGDAVSSAFPPRTRLAPPGSVRIEDGVALVDLTTHALDAGPPQRAQMLAQLRASLRPLPEVDDVAITVNGGKIEVPPVPGDLAADAAVDGLKVGLVGERVARAPGAAQATEAVDLPALTGLGPSHPAISHAPGLAITTQRRVAVLTSQRSQLRVLTPGQEQVPAPVLTGPDLTAPSFDRYGWVWSTTARSTGVVTAVSPTGEVVSVPARWLAGHRVLSVRAARDGARLVVTSTTPEGRGQVAVAGVVRGRDLAPSALSPSGPLLIAPHLEQVQEAAWVGQDQVAVLGTAEGQQVRVHLLRVGSPALSSLSPVPGATGLTGGNGAGSVLVWTPAGVQEQAGATWVAARGLAGVRQVAYPG